MKARPRSGVGGIGGAAPVFASPYPDAVATTPVDAMMAFAAFSANQALAAQIDFAHSFSRALHGQAVLVAAGERAFAPGPIRATVAGAALLQAEFARQVARAAQAMGRKYGHLAFAFPVAPMTR